MADILPLLLTILAAFLVIVGIKSDEEERRILWRGSEKLSAVRRRRM